MAITFTQIQGTDTISSVRVTINENFAAAKAKIDLYDGIIVGSSAINTGTLVGETASIKNLNVTTGGKLTLTNSELLIGSTSNGISWVNSTSGPKISAHQYGTDYFSSFTGGSTGATSVGFKYVVFPRLPTTDINALSTPPLGSVVYDVSTNKLKVCTASGATGTWTDLN